VFFYGQALMLFSDSVFNSLMTFAYVGSYYRMKAMLEDRNKVESKTLKRINCFNYTYLTC